MPRTLLPVNARHCIGKLSISGWTFGFFVILLQASICSTKAVETSGTHLRRHGDANTNSGEQTLDDFAQREIYATWKADGQSTSTRDSKVEKLEPIGKVYGDEAIVVFYDRFKLEEERRKRFATYTNSSIQSGTLLNPTPTRTLVNFDIRTSSHCVVSICGQKRTWYLKFQEECFDVRMAPKGSENIVRGLSAAFSSTKPVADKLYLKFDATNYIDGSPCLYDIFGGEKILQDDPIDFNNEIALT
uniref:Uncharacterized protein AlNc14C260G9800 n=1 Tax=Albugo laibachii Nc14 TaxID=890382 RepID=F0WTX7_9STRA|nr:conserved hypothetical protein [Albugo laibachii Nc14]CCA26305.1 conserved hypothetical protein [Albugo laibachii Nc14]|eukprot:CCA26305.1 conserved hypothetical protein [Albugo laibachii Nc14]